MDLKKMTNIGVLSALSLILMITIKFPIIPVVPYLLYEAGDLPILIIAFLYGPGSAVGATLILSILMFIFVGLGGPFGAFMHFLATGTLVFVAGYIYHQNRTQKTAVYGLIAGSIAMTVIMAFANVLLTPIFYGIPRQEVLKVLVPGIIPFNITKAFINSGLTLLVYKKLAEFLKSKGVLYSLNN
ncbi:ECF transporter S component [Orenia metallireducens]|jgi:riboflavin transporter FmnP|uniref:Riboflavin transporter n=1 Tax=Orenia metallireducens TaxID=1413210 RepID=A0A1C0ABE2_9FIRM|nr:ECF transporter S component [Orenia metallireducens]OCL27687.1 ECF transporter S component [Orenia metallireducens]